MLGLGNVAAVQHVLKVIVGLDRRRAIDRKCAKSRWVSRPKPSAMFAGADRADADVLAEIAMLFGGHLGGECAHLTLQFVRELLGHQDVSTTMIIYTSSHRGKFLHSLRIAVIELGIARAK